jgi:hypothetical protein
MTSQDRLVTMDGTNEIEVQVAMRMAQRILLVEGTRMSQSLRELPALFVGRENSSVTGQNRAARRVPDWDIAALMMRFGGSLAPKEVM